MEAVDQHPLSPRPMTISGASVNFPISWPLGHGMTLHVVFVVVLAVDDMRRRRRRIHCRNGMAELAVVYDGENVDKE